MPSHDLQALLDAAVDGIVILDHQGRIATFNRSAGQLFGFTADEVLGRHVEALMPDARIGDQHSIGVGRQVTAQRKDGSFFPALLSLGRVLNSDPPRFVGFVRDISTECAALATIEAERDRAEARRDEELQLRRLRERMTHVSRMATMGEMAAGIAHEINQPLSAIATYARACERFLKAPTPDLQETIASLQEISQEALRAGGIIRRLRQLVSGRVSQYAPTDVNELIQDLSVLANADARMHKVTIELDLTPGLPNLLADRTQLQQMILTLVHNSIESLADLSSAPRIVWIRTALLPDRRVEVSICDNGPGVAPDVVERLFIPFVTTKPEGTGLGLAISQTIAQAHGGIIGHRPLDPGACFFVRLPTQETVA